jgi:hypothetical protein
MASTDINGHHLCVDKVIEKGTDMIRNGGDNYTDDTKQRLSEMNTAWEALLGKARDKHLQLQDALREVSCLH